MLRYRDLIWNSLSLSIMRLVIMLQKVFAQVLIVQSNSVLYSFTKDFNAFLCLFKSHSIRFCSHSRLSLFVLSFPFTNAKVGLTFWYNIFLTTPSSSPLHFYISYDADSLFTNILLKQTINFIIYKMYNEKLPKNSYSSHCCTN